MVPNREEYIKAIHCHPAYLTYMQSTSCELPGWKKHKLELGLQGEISVTSDIQMTPPLWQKTKRNLRVSWWKWKRRVKSWLKTQHSRNEDYGIWSHHFMTNKWGNNGNSDRLYFWRLQNHCRWWLQPWNLKSRLLLGRKAMTNLDSSLKSRHITLPAKVRLVKAMVFSSSRVWMW